jgi:hypothetical protein
MDVSEDIAKMTEEGLVKTAFENLSGLSLPWQEPSPLQKGLTSKEIKTDFLRILLDTEIAF